jgi:hypothetical protein
MRKEGRKREKGDRGERERERERGENASSGRERIDLKF